MCGGVDVSVWMPAFFFSLRVCVPFDDCYAELFLRKPAQATLSPTTYQQYACSQPAIHSCRHCRCVNISSVERRITPWNVLSLKVLFTGCGSLLRAGGDYASACGIKRCKWSSRSHTFTYVRPSPRGSCSTHSGRCWCNFCSSKTFRRFFFP